MGGETCGAHISGIGSHGSIDIADDLHHLYLVGIVGHILITLGPNGEEVFLACLQPCHLLRLGGGIRRCGLVYRLILQQILLYITVLGVDIKQITGGSRYHLPCGSERLVAYHGGLCGFGDTDKCLTGLYLQVVDEHAAGNEIRLDAQITCCSAAAYHHHHVCPLAVVEVDGSGHAVAAVEQQLNASARGIKRLGAETDAEVAAIRCHIGIGCLQIAAVANLQATAGLVYARTAPTGQLCAQFASVTADVGSGGRRLRTFGEGGKVFVENYNGVAFGS